MTNTNWLYLKIYFTSPKFSGLYFWSVIAADFGVLISAIAFGTLSEALPRA